MTANQRQHYVPQSYLRNFCTQNDHLFVFDKSNQQTRYNSVAQVAHERYFYDFPNRENPRLMENLFAHLEGRQLCLIRHLFKKIASVQKLPSTKPYDVRILTKDQKSDLAVVIAIQYLRTKLTRNSYFEIRQNLQPVIQTTLETTINTMLNSFQANSESRIEESERQRFIKYVLQLYNQENNLGESAESVLHAKFILSCYEELAQKLRSYIWMLGVNTSTTPIYTSDHPVVSNSSSGGLFVECSEIIFPIRKDLLLLMFEPVCFQHLNHRDSKLMELNSEEILRYNTLQTIQCHRLIFCSHDSFGLARDLCQQHPEICSVDRARIQVATNLEDSTSSQNP